MAGSIADDCSKHIIELGRKGKRNGATSILREISLLLSNDVQNHMRKVINGENNNIYPYLLLGSKLQPTKQPLGNTKIHPAVGMFPHTETQDTDNV